MDPASLIREVRERHGLSQARLAHRARTTQAAISRIERGEEAVTWERLRGLLHAVGEEPTLASERIEYDGDPTLLWSVRRIPEDRRLASALASNRNVSELRLAVATDQRKKGEAVRIADTEPFDAEAILRILAEFGVEHVVTGGVAVQAHATPRLTLDLDLVPRPDLVNFARLAEALIDLEAVWRTSRQPLPLTEPHRLARADQLVLATRFGKLDVLTAEHTLGGSYDDLRRNAVERPYGDLVVLVAGLDDLIRMKRIAGRPKDLHDIATLTKPQDELNREAEEFERRLREQLEDDD